MVVNQIIIVPYSAEKMYAVVDDIAAYPAFLPWCADAAIKRVGQQINARLFISYRGLKTCFATANTHIPTSRISMTLQDGPLSALSGEWHFMPIDDNRCRVEFNLNYQFNNSLMEKIFKGLFQHIFDRFTHHFVDRANVQYGPSGRSMPDKMEVDVVSADNVPVQRLVLPRHSTVADALSAAGVSGATSVGIFGQVCSLETPLSAGDRVEIYRPLPNDPRLMRRQKMKNENFS